MAGNGNKHRRLHESVTVQGLEQICDTNSGPFRRIVWFLIFTGGLAFTSFNIYTQVLLYKSTPINVRVDELLGRTLPFPTITICNINSMKKSVFEKNGVNIDVVSLVYPYRDFEEDHQNITVSELSDVFAYMQKDPIGSVIQMTPSIEAMLLKCDWRKKPCGLNHFTNTFTDMALCYSFNANGSQYVQSSGRAHGLRLVLNVEEDEYVRSNDGYIGTGFMVAVHPPEVPAIMSEMGIAVYPGHQHFMGIKVEIHTSSKGVPSCGSKKLDILQGNYSREACKFECKINFIIKHCNCTYLPSVYNMTYCSVEEYSKCVLPMLEEYLQNGTNCDSECQEPCSYNTFTTQHSSSPLSRDYITQYTKAKGQTEEHWRRNLVILEVYLSSMAYEHMEKQLGYEIMDLFCDIGGALGLLLGASILTVLEVVDYICRISLSRIYRATKAQQTDAGT